MKTCSSSESANKDSWWLPFPLLIVGADFPGVTGYRTGPSYFLERPIVLGKTIFSDFFGIVAIIWNFIKKNSLKLNKNLIKFLP